MSRYMFFSPRAGADQLVESAGVPRAARRREGAGRKALGEIWRREFDGAYAEHGWFLLTMHPHIVGHRSRMSVLEELVQYIRSHPGVWFATHEQVARYVKAEAKLGGALSFSKPVLPRPPAPANL